MIRGREKPWGPTYTKSGLFFDTDWEEAARVCIDELGYAID